ncbi:plasmid mobilization protein MobA [Tepidicella xavieri]|jgi:hypothetical protein|uniref:Ribbon-helix-helix CopG family protein n=1 Tax=Tepidicella xavieri TaxID=360241 RepID=A0A4R6TWX1_9BURK|nr:plasmid mobilization protein MobA [Tepidicella xavieri]TDQ37766.1 ribbon-helix-helix CopG family protein [Tepidicella xavieri]
MSSEQRKRTIVRPVRLTKEEDEVIQAKARDGGMTVSGFLRAAALGRKVRSTIDAQVINELRRLGGLQKKIHNDTGGSYSKETADILRAIKDAIERLGRGDLQGDGQA